MMTENAKVSILIPLYNAESYISETLDSCLQQTYKNIEIIIVDDTSTDASLSIVKMYEDKHSFIKVYTQKNSGAATARNKAFEMSTGKYIQYLDADDLLDKDKILFQMNILKDKDNRIMSFGKWGTFHKNTENVTWKYPPVNKDYDDTKQFLIDLWSSGMTVVIYSWLFPRLLIEESEGWNESLSRNDDGEFSARIVFSADQIIFAEESKGYYRKDNGDSLSNQITKKALISNLKTFETYIALMKNNMDEDAVKKSLVQVYSKFLYKIPLQYNDIILETKNKINDLGYKKPIYKLKGYSYFLSYFLGIRNVLQLKRLIKRLLYYTKM